MNILHLPPSKPDYPVKEYFAGRQEIRKRLEEAATSPQTSTGRIFSICGRVGSGKTALLQMLSLYCRQKEIPAALYSAGARSPDLCPEFDLLKGLATGLKPSGLNFPSFTKSWNQVVQGVWSTGKEATGKLSIKFVEGDIKFDPSAMAKIMASKKGLTPLDQLRNAFVDDLNNAYGHPIVLMIDEYERIADLAEWLRGWAKELPPNVLVVFAGLSHFGRPEWQYEVWTDSLGPLEDDDRRAIVAKYYRYLKGTEPTLQQVDEILLSKSQFPMGLTREVYARVRLGYSGSNTPLDRVAETLRQLVPHMEQPLRRAFEAACIVRSFNSEFLEYLLGKDDIDTLFRDLQDLPWVEETPDGWLNVIAHVRVLADRNMKNSNDSKYRELHEKASSFCRKMLERKGGSKEDLVPKMRIWQLEYLYHEFHRSEEGAMPHFRQLFEDSILNQQFDFCKALLKEAKGYELSDPNKVWLQYYNALLDYGQGSKDAAVLSLRQLASDRNSERDLKSHALEFLGTMQTLAHDNEGAMRYYQRCLLQCKQFPEDRHCQVRVNVWLGNIAQSERGQGKKYLEPALDICKQLGDSCAETRPGIERELSNCHRLQGNFAKAEELINASLDWYCRTGNQFEEGHSLKLKGFLLLFVGRFQEAEESFNQSEMLFSKSSGGNPRVWEKVWPMLGLGEVALGRGQTEEARRYFHQVLELCTDQDFEISVAKGGLAEAYCSSKKWQEALVEVDKSLELRQKVHDKFGIGLTFDTKGRILIEQQKYEQASECLSEGRRRMEEYESWFGQSKLSLSLCQLYFRTGRVDKFQAEADRVKQWEGKKFFNHLAKLSFFCGLIDLRNWAVASAVKNLGNAMRNAVHYNIFLLDSLVEDLCAELTQLSIQDCTHKIDFISLLMDEWKSYGLVDTEESNRALEDIDGHHSDDTLQRLERCKASLPQT